MNAPVAVDDRLRHIAERDRLPGLVVLAAVNGRETLRFATGAADRERGTPPGPDTVYGLGSVSKSILALTAMHLVAEGGLDLHRPVAGVLGDHPVLAGVTAHHLLTHTSGLPPLDSRYWALDRAAPGVWSGGVQDTFQAPRAAPEPAPPGLGFTDHRGLLAYLDGLDIEPLGPPGARLSYSNEGYVLLGGLIAELAGAPYQDVARERVLEPLGLTRTAFIGSARSAALDDVAVPYARRDGGLAPVAWWDAPAWDGPGGVLSSARDVLALAEHLRRDESGMAAAMGAPHAPLTPAGEQQYGYGLRSSWKGGVRVIGHSGGRIGTSAHVAWIPERRAAAVALCNVAGGPAAEAAGVALGIDGEATADLPRLPDAFIDAGRAAGAYHSGETPTDDPALVVAVRDGALWAEAGGRGARLRAVSADRWVEDGAPEGIAPFDLHFLVDGTGPAWGVTMGVRVLTRRRRFRPK